MTFVRSLLYALVFYLGSVPIVLIALVGAPFSGRYAVAAGRVWAGFHYICVRWLLGIEVRVEGILPRSGAIIALKHEAMLETVEILRLIDSPAVVFKAELLRIPFWGAVARRHGVIPVERTAGAKALRAMLTAARNAINQGRPVVIFPEGTRVASGTAPPLRPGIAGLYKALGLPIVPVALDSGTLWPKRRFLKHAGVVTFLVGEAIPPGLPRQDVEARVHAGINALNRR